MLLDTPLKPAAPGARRHSGPSSLFWAPAYLSVVVGGESCLGTSAQVSPPADPHEGTVPEPQVRSIGNEAAKCGRLSSCAQRGLGL